MTFPQWRAQLRLHHSLTLLASGLSGHRHRDHLRLQHPERLHRRLPRHLRDHPGHLPQGSGRCPGSVRISWGCSTTPGIVSGGGWTAWTTRRSNAPLGEAAGYFAGATGRSFVLHIADELIHHTAEAALLRDLFARRQRALVVAAGLGPVTAHAHVAPAAAGVLADVEEQPAARVLARALPDPLERSPHQQFGGRPGHRPQHAVKSGTGLIPVPAEARRGPGDPEVGQGAGDLGLQHAEVVTRGSTSRPCLAE